MPHIVRIEKSDVGRARLAKAAVARGGESHIFLPDHAQPRVTGEVWCQIWRKVLGRTVVDNETFKIVEGLRANRPQSVADGPGGVESRNDNRYADGRHHMPSVECAR